MIVYRPPSNGIINVLYIIVPDASYFVVILIISWFLLTWENASHKNGELIFIIARLDWVCKPISSRFQSVSIRLIVLENNGISKHSPDFMKDTFIKFNIVEYFTTIYMISNFQNYIIIIRFKTCTNKFLCKSYKFLELKPQEYKRWIFYLSVFKLVACYIYQSN